MPSGEFYFGANKIVQDNLEKKLENWLRPIYNEYYEKIKIYDRKMPLMFISNFFRGARVFNSSKIGSEPNWAIGLPAKLIESAKNNEMGEIELYSGKKVSLPYVLSVRFLISHEIAHFFYKTEDWELDEGISDKIAFENIKDEPFGKDFISLKTSKLLVGANILGILACRDVQKIKIPYEIDFKKHHYEKIQYELDFYWKNREIIFKDFKMKPSIYAKGFVKLLNILE